MKKILVALILAETIFASCKKGDSGSGLGTISVSIDGSAKLFNTSAKATNTNGGSYPYVLDIQGYSGTSGASDYMVVEIQSPNPIGTGTFTEFAAAGAVARISYFVYTGPFSYTYCQAQGITTTTNPATITIDAINASSVRGSFKGDITLNGTGTNKKVLTNGVFNVSF